MRAGSQSPHSMRRRYSLTTAIPASPCSAATPASAPVVDRKDLGPVISRLVRPMHGDSVHVGAEPAGLHHPVCGAPPAVDAGDQTAGLARDSQRLGVRQQPAELLLIPRPHGPVLDERAAAAGLASRTDMADRKPAQPLSAGPQHGVAEIPCAHGPDLPPRPPPGIHPTCPPPQP